MELCVTYGLLPFPMSPTCTPHSPSLPFSLHSPHRQQLGAEYKKQVQGVLSQWEMDVEKSKELEEKLHKMLKEQQKLFQQQRIVQSQRLKTIKQLHEQYMKVKGT